MENILEIKGLKKEYKDFSLHDISFSLPMDCITGFIGVNGAGKTTTLKAILSLIPKESGSVQIFGMDMDTNEKAIKERIGIVLVLCYSLSSSFVFCFGWGGRKHSASCL